MVGDAEPAKILLPYVRRADELQKYEPLVAYYCRLYAMDRVVKIPKKEQTKTTNALSVSLMKQLEKDKKTVQLSSDDGLYVEGFATKLFMKADKQERRGKANMTTAKTFYAASLFFEILHNFGDVPFDLEQKQKYAAWKAAEIRKALKKVRKPFEGPPAIDKSFPVSDGGFSNSESSSQTIAADSHELRISLKQSPATGLEIDATNQPCKNLTNPKSILDTPSGGTISTTSNCNQQDSSDDDRSFHDCSEELDHDVFLSDATGRWLDHTISGPADVQDREYHPSAAEIAGHDVLFSNDTGSGSDPTISAPDDVQGHEYHSSAAEKTDRDALFSNDTGSGLDRTISVAADVQGEEFHPSAAEIADHDVLFSNDTGSWLDHTIGFPADAQGQEYHPSTAEKVDHDVLSNDIGSGSVSVPGDVQGQHYQPSPAEIVKALKVSRLAVSALASDNVPSAVSYIKQALDLLINPPQTQR